MRRSIAQYVAAPWCALAILLAACTGDGAAMEDERHVETPAPKPETPAEPDTLDTPNNPDNPDSTGNYTPKYESAKAVLKEILGDKYEDISAGMPQNITLTAQAIDAVTGISSVLESVTKASSEEHETENMTDAKTKVNTLTEKAGGSEEVLQDPSAEGLEKMLQAFNAEEAKQALQALVAQAEEMISVSKKENNELLGSFEDVNEPNKVADPKDGNNLYISASDEYKVSLSGEFDYFDNHIESLEGDIDISKLIIVSHEDRGDRVLVASSSLRKEIYEKLNLESKEGDALPTLKFGLTHDKDLGLKYFLDIYKKYNKSKKLKIDAHFISMDGRTLVEGVAEDEYTLFQADGNTAKASKDRTIKSFDINELVDFADTYHISRFSNLIISGDAKEADVNWQLTNIIFEGNMSQLTNTSGTSLKGIIYFKDLPYDNTELDENKRPYLDGALKLNKWASTLKIQVGLTKANVLDISNIDKNTMEKYSIKQGDVFSYGGISTIYFHESIEDSARKSDKSYDVSFYKKFISLSAGGIDNEYFGTGDRQDSYRSRNRKTAASKTPRKLSEFEYYGNNSYFEHAAVESYKDDFSSVTPEQRDVLKGDINVKLIAKVSTICPLC
ncbi:MAG: hypothetical protein HDR32_10910 [Treponema sp.]|nr:hypothetical protein [Treponema sp.]